MDSIFLKKLSTGFATARGARAARWPAGIIYAENEGFCDIEVFDPSS